MFVTRLRAARNHHCTRSMKENGLVRLSIARYLAFSSGLKSMKQKRKLLLVWYVYPLDSKVTCLLDFYGVLVSVVAAYFLWLLMILLWTLTRGNSTTGISLGGIPDYQIKHEVCNSKVPGLCIRLSSDL
jgi:hypothetical protein